MCVKADYNFLASSSDDLSRFYQNPPERTPEEREREKAEKQYQEIQARYLTRALLVDVSPERIDAKVYTK